MAQIPFFKNYSDPKEGADDGDISESDYEVTDGEDLTDSESAEGTTWVNVGKSLNLNLPGRAKMTPADFKVMLGITMAQFTRVMELLGKRNVAEDVSPLPVETALFCTLCHLHTGQTAKSISLFMRIGPCAPQIIVMLEHLAKLDPPKFPGSEEWAASEAGFRKVFGIPNVVGFVATTRITSYDVDVNYKLLVVSDSQLRPYYYQLVDGDEKVESLLEKTGLAAKVSGLSIPHFGEGSRGMIVGNTRLIAAQKENSIFTDSVAREDGTALDSKTIKQMSGQLFKKIKSTFRILVWLWGDYGKLKSNRKQQMAAIMSVQRIIAKPIPDSGSLRK